jgi:hypothetical protein
MTSAPRHPMASAVKARSSASSMASTPSRVTGRVSPMPVGVTGEAARDHVGRRSATSRRRRRWWCVLRGRFQHARDEADVDGFGLKRSRTRRSDALWSPLLGQAQQPVDLAHPDPGQRAVEDGGGVDTDGGPMDSGHSLQRLDVTHDVDLGAGGQIGGVGASAALGLAGMDVDQPAPVEDLDHPSVDPEADEVAGDRVQRLVHLDAVVAVDLGPGVEGQFVRPRWVRSPARSRTPCRRPALGLGQVGDAKSATRTPVTSPDRSAAPARRRTSIISKKSRHPSIVRTCRSPSGALDPIRWRDGSAS